ncbi:MAG TPA: hypothetical protein VKR27_01985, partial [Acidimicrobiales bacterium]|nr:hypothetical protein [Acidimicrobiales bacterium]
MTAIDAVEVTGVGELAGTARVPGDKSIAHRALMIAALADGTSEVTGLPRGDDVRRTRTALAALGAYFDGDSVIGGRDRLHAARHPLDAGNSGTMARLFLGLAASLPFSVGLDGDASVRSRPMDRVVEPLRLMGAEINGAQGHRLPLAVRGGELTGIDYTPTVASAQVKGALLFAGIGAGGTTTVHENVA